MRVGVVRAPVSTTVMQIASRLLLVWGVVDIWPHLAQSPFYSSMLTAWSVTEVIRYSYFALSLAGWLPEVWTILRYSTFYVLYPMGITSECALIYKAATGPSADLAWFLPYIFYGILAVYVPGMQFVTQVSNMADCCRVVHSLHAHDEAARQGHAFPQNQGRQVAVMAGFRKSKSCVRVWVYAPSRVDRVVNVV